MGRLVFVLLLCVNSMCYGNSFDGWEIFDIPGLYSFSVPPNMEIQGDNYKRLGAGVLPELAELEKVFSRVVLQQRGLNSVNPEAFSLYGRVAIVTKRLTSPMMSLNDSIVLSNEDILDFDRFLLGVFAQSGESTDSAGNIYRLIYATPCEVRQTNGIDCIYKYYETRMNDNPVVYNHVYLFFNGSLMHKVDIMYRSTEAEYWEKGNSDIRKVVESIVFVPCQ